MKEKDKYVSDHDTVSLMPVTPDALPRDSLEFLIHSLHMSQPKGKVLSQKALSKDMSSEMPSFHLRPIILESSDYRGWSDDLQVCVGW